MGDVTRLGMRGGIFSRHSLKQQSRQTGIFGELKHRINIPDMIPPDFDLDALLGVAAECDAIPPDMVDSTPTGIFSIDFTMDLLIHAKERFAALLDSCPGFDTSTYARFLLIDNDDLLALFNSCL
ncbi:hypothetical protein F5146DRAFT_1144126 [Armillaria mellea]|nr:hypothetical protein F5146DRAFT_1144126 [Armillaria mellea]